MLRKRQPGNTTALDCAEERLWPAAGCLAAVFGMRYLCICGVLEGIKDFLQCNGFACLLVNSFPHNTIGLHSNFAHLHSKVCRCHERLPTGYLRELQLAVAVSGVPLYQAWTLCHICAESACQSPQSFLGSATFVNLK